MKNSGLVSVGHLLNCKTPDQYKLTFQHFGTILQSNVCENTIYKLDSRWRFDQVRANSFKHTAMAGRSVKYLSTSTTTSIYCRSRNMDNVYFFNFVTLSTS